MTASLTDFLCAVLPASGVYVYAYSDDGGLKDGKMRQKVLERQDELVQTAGYFYQLPRDVWFALAAYKQGWHIVQTHKGEKNQLRTRNNARAVKALWLDLDVGEKKDYKTRAEALTALRDFCVASGMPCPWVVASGAAGLHVYWALEAEVTPDEWQYLADRLRAACEALGLHADPMRTRDIASVLRLPGTWNMKGGMTGAALVEIRVVGATMPYAFYKAKLDAYVPKATSHVPTLPRVNVPDYVKAAADSTLMRFFQIPKADFPERNAADIVAGCKQIRTMNDGKEPTWRAALSVLRFCTDGRETAERLSTDPKWHSEYSIDEKFAWLEANDIKPMHCSTFAEYRPEACEGCPFAGIVKSPISVPNAPLLAQETATAAPKDVTPSQDTSLPPRPAITLPVPSGWAAEGEDLSLAAEPESTLPKYEYQTVRVNEGGCFVRCKDAEGDWYWRNIYPYPVYPVQRIKARTATGEVQMSYVFRKHHLKGYDDVQIPGETLMGQGLNAYLGSVGFLLHDKDRKLMGQMLIELLKQTESTLAETTVTDQLGWDKDQQSFLLGDKLYKADGSVIEIAPKGKAAIYSGLTRPRGSLDTWKAIAETYNRKGMEWAQTTLAAAFASPLMPIGALESAALLFLTGEKGAGKSAALSLGISVYGDPSPRTGLMINKEDTYIARFAKLGIMNNIAAGFDEMTDISPKDASDIAYQLTQGRGKDRMQSGGENLQLNTTFWSCLPVMSANSSIIASLANHSHDASAQMSRVLEIKVKPLGEVYSPEEFEENERLIRKLPQNYGVAGDVYIRYVTTHKEEIEDELYEMEKLIRKRAGIGSNYRFWSYMTTRMMVGMRIARDLGLINYDLDNLLNYLLALIAEGKQTIGQSLMSPEGMIAQFMNEHEGARIVVAAHVRPSDMPDQPGKGVMNDVNYVKKQTVPGRGIQIRYEMKEERAFISMPAIKQWCKRQNIGAPEFISNLEALYGKVIKPQKIDLGGFTVSRGAGKTECICVKIPLDISLEGYENLTEENS